MFKVINDFNEYKQFIQSTYDDFKCEEEWEDFFGFHLKWDEETGEVLETLGEYKGKIEHCPEEFPVVIHYTNENEDDFRAGNLTIRQLDWITIKTINKKLGVDFNETI